MSRGWLLRYTEIRARFKSATGAMVESAAIEAFAELVEAYADELLQDVVRRHQRDCEVRVFHKIQGVPLVRPDHIRPASRNHEVAGPATRGDEVTRARQEVENEKDAPEVA